MSHRKRAVLSGLFIAVLLPTPGMAQAQYVRVTRDSVNIRLSARPNAPVVAQAHRGDTFELKSTIGDRYEIATPSGEHRYVHRSLAEVTDQSPSAPTDAQARRACRQYVRAENRAMIEAERRHPNDFERAIDLERILEDRYKLLVLREYGIPPAHNTTVLVVCATNSAR